MEQVKDDLIEVFESYQAGRFWEGVDDASGFSGPQQVDNCFRDAVHRALDRNNMSPFSCMSWYDYNACVDVAVSRMDRGMKPDNAARAFCAVINKSFLAKESEGKKPAAKQVKFEESKKDAPTPPDAKAPEKPKSTQKEENAKKKGPDEGASSSKQVPKKKEKPPKKSEGFTIEEPDHGAGVGKPEAKPPPQPKEAEVQQVPKGKTGFEGKAGAAAAGPTIPPPRDLSKVKMCKAGRHCPDKQCKDAHECKYSNCNKSNCKFRHPVDGPGSRGNKEEIKLGSKDCRDGKDCKRANCMFRHPETEAPIESGAGCATSSPEVVPEEAPSGDSNRAKLRGAVKKFQVPIPLQDAKLKAYADEKGLDYTMVKKPVNPHGTSAFNRTHGEVACVLDALSMREFEFPDLEKTGKLTIADMYGGGSTTKITVKKGDLEVEWVNCEVWPVAGEAARYPAGRDASRKCDFGIVWDTYYGGPGSEPSSPATLLQYLDRTHSGLLYVGTRKFCGPDAGACGADVFSADGETWVEGRYVRVDGKIRFTSDVEVGNAYPDHPDNDWMFTYAGGAGIDLYSMGARGPYHMFRCTRSKDDRPMSPRAIPEDRFVEIDVSCGSGKSRMLVDLKTAERFLASNMPARGFKEAATREKVNSALRTDPVTGAIWHTYPSHFARLATGTLQYSLFHRKEKVVEEYHDTRVQFASADRKLAHARVAGDNIDETWVDRAITTVTTKFGGITDSVLQKEYKSVLTAGIGHIAYAATNPTTLEGAALGTTVSAVAATGWSVRRCCRSSAFGMARDVTAGVTYLLYGSAWGIGIACTPWFLGSAAMLLLLLLLMRKWVFGGVRAINRALPWNRRKRRFEELCVRKRVGEKLDQVHPEWYRIPEAATIPSTVMRHAVWLPEEDIRGALTMRIGEEVFHSVRDAGDTLEKCSDPIGKACMRPLVFCDSDLVLPGFSPLSLVDAVEKRLMKKPKHQAEDGVFDQATAIFTKLFSGHRAATRSMEDCVKLMGGQRGKRLANYALKREQGYDRVYCELMMKRNETIALTDDGEGGARFKARIICPVGEACADLLPESRGMDELMHAIFDDTSFEVVDLEGHIQTVRLTYCSGYSAAQLSQLAREMVDCGHWWIAMCGDDTFGTDGHEFFESDYSMFDSTQGDALLEAGTRVLSTSMTAEWLKVFKFIMTSKLRTQSTSPIEVMLDVMQAMQKSGLPPTSWWNWFANAFGQVRIVHMRPMYETLQETVEKATAECGFTVKCKVLPITEVTFLKGCFVPGPQGLQWLPLVSQVLKLGKVLGDPLLCFTKKAHGGDYNRACRLMCTALAAGYERIPDDYPVLGAFIRCYKRIGLTVRGAQDEASCATNFRNVAVEDFDYKPSMTGAKTVIDAGEAMQFICNRYDTTPEEVQSLENMFDQVDRPQVVVQHPLLLKLAAADYGC